MSIKKFTLLLASMLLSVMLFAQVTTSGLSGKIVGKDNLSLPGATIIAIHVPSGTKYATITDSKGFYRIPNMRIGGPYNITVSYVGFKTINQENINLNLGQTFSLNFSMDESATMLKGVEITSTRNALIDGTKTGATTNISRQQILTIPSISRSISDFTRLSPQASGGSNFGGQDSRYNNVTIDGANFNDNFGLSSKNLPGGDAQPISLDAIEEVSINIAPFDVRQSNFTGANVNAVTKSGDNQFKGSAYTYYRDKSFNGDMVGLQKLTVSPKSTKTYGARFAGPIIKDKLFFFVNYESEKSDYPSTTWVPSDPEKGIVPVAGNNVSRTTVNDLKTMSDFLKNTYSFDPGKYQNFDNFKSQNHKILAKIDWNINKKNKFTIRYNYVKSTNDVAVSTTSSPSSASTYGRISDKSMAFSNSNYGYINTVGSLTAELNSVFGNKAANKLLASYTKIRDERTSGNELFPFVDIYNAGNPYMTFGSELYAYQNDLKNNILNLTDNFNLYFGKHTITVGASYDKQYFANSYKPFGNSYYRFASMSDFMTGKAPTQYAITYPYQGAGDGYAILNFGYASAYMQDEYQVSNNLKITGGIRFELPIYLDKLTPNPAVDALTFKDLANNDQKLIVGNWPKSAIQVSPRLGFNWDAKGDRSLQVRGGTGLFTGRLPFVWFTNQPSNSGTLQNTVKVTNAAQLANLKFNPDPFAYVKPYSPDPLGYGTLFPSKPSSSAPGQIAIVSKDFKMPQVWRSNLAADFKLPWWGLVLTLEGIYSKDINAIVQYNANQKSFDAKLPGADNRPIFSNTNYATTRVNTAISSAMVLSNTNQGHSYSLTAQISKQMTKGFFGSLAYTYFNSKDLTSNPGSVAYSAWSYNQAVNGQNDPGLSYSQFAIPHRVVGTVSYRAEYLKHLATTVTLIYDGSNQGRICYIYSNDLNNDGNYEDLMYIPKNESEIQFSDIKSGSTVVWTAAQQSQAYWAYANQDKYLSAHKGQYAERYGVLLPWNHRFDLKILQDVFTKFGANRNHSLQITLDIFNVGNLINSSWGIRKKQAVGGYDISLLKYTGIVNNVPTFQLQTDSSGAFPKTTFVNSVTTSTTWYGQIGLRYTF